MISSIVSMLLSLVLGIAFILFIEWMIDIVKDLIRLVRGDKEDVVTREECHTPFYGSDELASAYDKSLNKNRGGSQNDSITN